jgi:cell division septum initiation protein DivIVA
MDTKPKTKATPVNEAVADVAKTVAAGDAPTNEQLNRVLDHTQDLLESKKKEAPLNPTGQSIASQMQTVVGDAKTLVNEKNAGDRLQTIVSELREGTKDLSKQASKEARDLKREAVGRTSPIAKELTKDAQELLDAAKDMTVELVKSREFRSLMVEMLDLLNEVIVSGSKRLQEGIREGSQKLQEGAQRAQETLQEGTQKASEKIGEARAEAAKPTSEWPTPAESASRGKEQLQQAKQDVKQKVDETKQKLEEKKPELTKMARDTVEQVKSGAQEMAKDVRGKAKQTVEEIKAGQVPSVVPLTEEQRVQLRRRVDEMLSRMSRNPSFKRGMQALIRLLDQLQALADSANRRSERLVDSAKQNPHLREAWYQFQELVASFAQGYDVQRLIDDLYAWFDFVQQQPELRSWWYDLRTYVNEAINNPDVVLDDVRAGRLNQLIDRARDFAEQIRYSDLTDKLMDDFRDLIDAIQNDPTTNKLISDIQQLVRTLFLDDKGNFTWKPDHLNQFKILVLSLVLEELKYIPVPTLSGSTDEYDFMLRSVNFYGYDLLPEHILIKFESVLDLNLKEIQADRAASRLTIHITNIKCHVRNAHFWFRKKRGLIRLEDSGRLDFDIAGDGASLLIVLDWDANSKKGFITRRVALDIDRLNIHVRDARHDWLLNLLSPIVSNDVKRSIEREVNKRIKYQIDRTFANIRDVVAQVDVEKAANIVKEQLRDVQATKNALETA